MRLGTDSGHLEKPQVDEGRRYDRPVLSLSVKVQQQADKRVDAERSARGLGDLNRVGILFECAIAGSTGQLSRHTGDEESARTVTHKLDMWNIVPSDRYISSGPVCDKSAS